MDKMQEDAMHRVRQMQSTDIKLNQNQKSQAQNNISEKNAKNIPEIADEKSALKSEIYPITELFKDKEKLLILLLIMLLSQEGTNLELVLALLYIII